MSDESRENSPEHNFEDARENFTETHPRISRGRFVETLPKKIPEKIFSQRRTREYYKKFRRDERKNVSSNFDKSHTRELRVTPNETYFSKFGTE